MEQRNGMTYPHNYDVVTKWLADALRGATLDVLGIKSARIEDVFGFEPVEITLTADRVDIMARDEAGQVFHIEEQRNLRKEDLYRFAAYHFLAAKRWGTTVTDVILASGEVMAGDKSVTTRSGTYTPIVIDFTQRDGEKRLQEIREAVQAGSFDRWVELVFLPLYGTHTGEARSVLVEQVLRFESELCQAGRLSREFMAATLIMSNKLIDKARLSALWEEIKMLEVLEVAREKGLEEGEALGIQKGKTIGGMEATREILVSMLIDRFGLMPARISTRIRKLDNLDVLKGLVHQALICQSLDAFDAALNQVGEPI